MPKSSRLSSATAKRKFRSSNFRLYWKLPLGLAASMLDSRDVLQHRCATGEILAGRTRAKCCVLPKFCGARKGRSEKRELRRIGEDLHHACARERFGSPNRKKLAVSGRFLKLQWASQNSRHACARKRFWSQNRSKLAGSEHFWKFSLAKFAPRLRARAVWKSKS